VAKAARRAPAVLVAALAMMVAGPASAKDGPIATTGQREATLVLHVVNYAAVSRDVMDEARARVAKVYEVIGVRTEWVDGEDPVRSDQDGRLHLTVVLLSREMAEKKISAEGIKDDVLGQAHPPSRRAHIFCDRIATIPGAPTVFSIPLGDVIAHEVGHLVLSANSHSRSGIMRAHMDVHAKHLQSFDQTQARTIRTTLMQMTTGGACLSC
jgi:hypothetical protein